MIHRTKLATIVAFAGLLSAVAGMSPTVAAAASAEAPMSAAQLNTIAQENPKSFAGVYIDKSNVVHVEVVPGIDRTTLSEMRQAAMQSTSTKIVLDTVPRSEAQLRAVMSQVTTKQPWAGDVAKILSSWSIDPVTDKVAIGLTEVTPQLQQEARRVFGDMVVLHRQDRFSALDNVIKVKNPRIVHVDAAALQARPNTNVAGPPLVDFEPYLGGDRMIRLIYDSDGEIIAIEQCTAGLVWNNGSSTPFMASAGHCGPINYSWTQGYYDPDANEIYETGPMGTAFANGFGEGGIDGMLLDNDGEYLTELWENLSGSYTATGVTSLHNAVVGEHVCTDGSFTGTKCSGVVTVADACDDVKDKNPETGAITIVTVCHETTAVSTEQIVQSGDSGGPVFFGDPSKGNGVAATGIISAGSDDGKTVLYTNRIGMSSFFSGDFDTL